VKWLVNWITGKPVFAGDALRAQEEARQQGVLETARVGNEFFNKFGLVAPGTPPLPSTFSDEIEAKRKASAPWEIGPQSMVTPVYNENGTLSHMIASGLTLAENLDLAAKATRANTAAMENPAVDSAEGDLVTGAISGAGDIGSSILSSLGGTLMSAVTDPLNASLEKYLGPTSTRLGNLADILLSGLDVPMSFINGGLDTLINVFGGKRTKEERLTGGAYQYAMAGAGGGGMSASSAVHVGTMNINGVKDGKNAGEMTVREIAAYNELNSRSTASGMKRGMVKREAQER
jgi:hypothetical protein